MLGGLRAGRDINGVFSWGGARSRLVVSEVVSEQVERIPGSPTVKSWDDDCLGLGFRV